MLSAFRSSLVALCVAALPVAAPIAAHATTIDFTDGIFTPVTASNQAGALGLAQPLSFTEVSDGVTFAFEALVRIAGDLRFTGIAGAPQDVVGIRVGGASSSLVQFSFTASEDILLNGYTIGDGTNNIEALANQSGISLTMSVFEGLGSTGTLLSELNSLTPAGGNVALNLTIAAGQTVTFAIEGGGLGGGLSTAIASLASFDFERTAVPPPPPVPLPAAGFLLIGGLGALTALRRARKI